MFKTPRQLFCLGTIALSFCLTLFADVTIENREMRLILGDDSRAISLIHKATGQECLASGVSQPAFSLVQYRPYDNEIQLAYPARSTTFVSKSVVKDGDRLLIRFDTVEYEASVFVQVTDEYIAFRAGTLRSLSHPGVRFPRYDEFVILQLPLRLRTRFGDWLNTTWDDQVAVNLLGADPYAKIDSEERPGGYRIFRATAADIVKGEGVGAALIVTETKQLLDRVQKVEEDFGLPSGVASRRSPEYKWSYYWMGEDDLSPANIDRHIAYAKQGGFRTMVVYYLAFSRSAGHFPWRPDYPNGMADLKGIVQKIKDAGMIPGLHFHFNKAHKHDPYVTPRPDPRLNLQRILTLSKPLDTQATSIEVEENPRGSSMREEQRFLKIGSEIISYTEYTTERPYRYTGCRRGQLGTSAASHQAGAKFGVLDVDEWPVFVRFDQRTSIQQEAAARLGEIYREAGFRFVYFDGAEDVHEPYWFMVSWPQWLVYKELKPAPLFAEGAAKAHFSWHILSRGNAFDHFAPEVIKAMTAKHPAQEAERIIADFTRIDFGWLDFDLPSEKTIGMQPDMFEYVTSRAAAWGCPISIQPSLELLDKHPRTADNLEVLRRWEEVRARNWLTEAQKRQLRELDQEHLLILNERKEFELVPYAEITGLAEKQLRAFRFKRAGKSYVVYWHIYGDGRLSVPLQADEVKILEEIGGQTVPAQTANGFTVPVGKRRYLESDRLNEEQLATAFQRARLVK